jgi:hypothetical protein
MNQAPANYWLSQTPEASCHVFDTLSALAQGSGLDWVYKVGGLIAL